MSDPWDADWFLDAKRQKEDWVRHEPFEDAFAYLDCPHCERHVGAFLVDGPDPVFADVQCPRCGHRWPVWFREGRWETC